MGSVCTIAVADYPLGETKSDPPDDWISFFAPSDFIKQRRLRSKRNPLIWGAPNAEDSRIREFVYEYRIPAWVARDRLDLFGYTVDALDAAYRAWHREETVTHRHIDSPFPLRGIGAARARRIIGSLVQRRVVHWDKKNNKLTSPESELLDRIIHNGPPFDTRLLIRAIIDHVDPNAQVVLDLTDRVAAGYYRASDAAHFASAHAIGGSRLVVLTEGVTDTEVLQKSVALLYPHLSPFFVWPDLTVRAMGGTSGIEHTLKALLPLGIRAPMIALFDNDHEGHQTIKRISRTIKLSSNVRLIAYPDIDSAKAWPTDLPTGRSFVDLNRKACIIELYYGSDVLGRDDSRSPVRWGNAGSPGEGQGSIQGKDVLKGKFMEKAQASTPAKLVGDWNDMRKLVSSLLRPFEITIAIRDEY